MIQFCIGDEFSVLTPVAADFCLLSNKYREHQWESGRSTKLIIQFHGVPTRLRYTKGPVFSYLNVLNDPWG